MSSALEKSPIMPHHSLQTEPLQFMAFPICYSSDGPLPSQISTHASTFKIKEFAQVFSLLKWSPILIAQGISSQAFDQLIQNNEQYGSHFKYEHDPSTGRFFLIDSPSRPHEYYAALLSHAMPQILEKYYRNPFRCFRFLPSVGIQMENDAEKVPDSSVWVSEEFHRNEKDKEIPFLIVESAVSQTRQSLMQRLGEWKGKGIPCVMGIDKKESKKEVDFITFIGQEEASQKTFKFGELATIDFHLKKSLITKGYDLGEFEIDPSVEVVHVYLEDFLVI